MKTLNIHKNEQLSTHICTLLQGSCTFCEIKFHDFSMEYQQNSMTSSKKGKILHKLVTSYCTYKYYLNCHEIIWHTIFIFHDFFA